MKFQAAHLLIAVLLAVVHGGRRPCLSAQQNKAGEGGDIVFPGANVQQCPQNTGSCVPMAQCARAFSGGSRKNFPTICKWEDSSPFVCCPKETSARLKTKPVEFPEADCAAPQKVRVGSGGTIVKRQIFHVSVVGGEDVPSIDIYPFMVAIYQTNGNNELFLCGGTLLSRTAILTAAHCFLAKDASSQYRVKLGSLNSQTVVNASRDDEFDVVDVKIHSGFKFPELYNDIAIIKINQIPGYKTTIRPICLFNKAMEKTAPNTINILGWGSKQAGGASSAILQEANIEIISNPNCSSTLNRLGALSVSFPKGLNNRILCAGNTQGTSKDACQGDSGGPAVVVIDGLWRQRGVVSSGVGCGVPGNPGIYTRVSEYETWIKENA